MRFRNPIFGILSFVVGGLFLDIFKETSWAIFVERILEEAAHSLHIERVAMIATLSQVLLAGGILWAALYFAFRVGRAERSQASPLEIIYNPNNPLHVEAVEGHDATRYYIEVFNTTYDRSITDLVVVWNETPLTNFIENQTGNYGPLISGSISPRQKRRVYLMGIDNGVIEAPDPRREALGVASHFVIKARGKDAAEVTATFEYSPLRRLKIVRVD